MRNSIFITLTALILTFTISSCIKEDWSIDKSINIKIGNTTITDNATLLGISYDVINHFSLSENGIYFSGIDCFYYGGLSFSDDLKKVESIYPLDGACRAWYIVDTDDRNTYSSVNITRNDNAIGGIIEGTFSGKAYRCVSSTNCDDRRYYNFSGSFKLAIRE